MADVWTDIASELLHLYPRGRRLLAVAGADAERSRHGADELAAALETAGLKVERVHTADGDEQALRTEVVAPFRATTTATSRLSAPRWSRRSARRRRTKVFWSSQVPPHC